MQDRARSYYDAGRYDEALAELAEGYRVYKKPNYFFNVGQIQRKKNNCREAVAAYERFLSEAAAPTEEMRTIAVDHLAEARDCESAHKRRIMRAAGWSLIGVGAASAIAAGLFALEAKRDSDRASRGPYDPSVMADGERADRFAIGLSIGALVTAVSGATLLWLAPRTAAPHLSVSWDGGGVLSVAYRRGF
jgi:tetratricopeptide (TPR) repeat protein